MEGHQTVESVIGPMGHSISDLRLLLKTIISTEPWLADPKANKIPWRQEDEDAIKAKIQTKKLTFGVIRTDGMVNPHPPVQRAINEAVEALKARGHEVIEWNPPAHAEAFQILVRLSPPQPLSSYSYNCSGTPSPPTEAKTSTPSPPKPASRSFPKFPSRTGRSSAISRSAR